jgi:hypothetical protein
MELYGALFFPLDDELIKACGDDGEGLKAHVEFA